MTPQIDTRPAADGLRWGIYFAITHCRRYIKIGLSHKPGARLRFLRYMAKKEFNTSRVKYLGIIAANPQFENTLHVHFARFRKVGEWFHASPELLGYIETCRPHFVPVHHFYGQKIPQDKMHTLWADYWADTHQTAGGVA